MYPARAGHPVSLPLDQTGIHAANEDSDTIIEYWFDSVEGTLTPSGWKIRTESPVCLVFR